MAAALCMAKQLGQAIGRVHSLPKTAKHKTREAADLIMHEMFSVGHNINQDFPFAPAIRGVDRYDKALGNSCMFYHDLFFKSFLKGRRLFVFVCLSVLLVLC